MPVARTYEELRDAIARNYPRLSPQLQRLARHALERPDDFALGTVAKVAQANDVQPSSTIRFAKALGFNGFTQMQQLFQSHLVDRSTPYRERIARMRESETGQHAERGVLHQFVGAAYDELHRLEAQVDARTLASAVRILATSRQLYILAQRRAFPIACYLAYAINQLDLRAHLLDGVGGMLGEFTRGIGSGDALLVASFRNYTPVVIETAMACQGRGISVVAITDNALSPLKAVSDVCFELGDDPSQPFRSLVAPLCLAQALVVSIGHRLAAANRKPERRRTVNRAAR